jgi:hypothetical protein
VRSSKNIRRTPVPVCIHAVLAGCKNDFLFFFPTSPAARLHGSDSRAAASPGACAQALVAAGNDVASAIGIILCNHMPASLREGQCLDALFRACEAEVARHPFYFCLNIAIVLLFIIVSLT